MLGLIGLRFILCLYQFRESLYTQFGCQGEDKLTYLMSKENRLLTTNIVGELKECKNEHILYKTMDEVITGTVPANKS